MNDVAHAPVTDRVRANTWPALNHSIDTDAQLRLRSAAANQHSTALATRITQLDREWDFDRTLETEASIMGLVGLALGVVVDRRLLALPAFVAAMLLLHATHGWYPLLPVFRRMGVRTRDEIDREHYALKALRGDFAAIPPAGSAARDRASAAWKAVCQ